MTIKLIKKNNQMLCLTRNNKEITNSNSDSEELRKLVTETTDDADTQARMDSLLNDLQSKDAFSD